MCSKEAQKFNDDPPEGCHGNPIDGDCKYLHLIDCI